MTEEIRSTCKSQEKQPSPPARLLPKRWIAGRKLYKSSTMQKHNEAIQRRYHIILNQVKKLLAPYRPTVFEKDYRFDNTENSFALHAFLSETFYFYIECDFTYFYRVEYAFNNCKHEAEIRKLLDNYTFKERAKEISVLPDFNTFYDNVLAFQHERFVYVLKA